MRMISIGILALIPAILLQDADGKVCRHKSGRTVRFDPVRAGRARNELLQGLRATSGRVRRVSLSLDEPFDGGLPACTVRKTRLVKRPVPARLVGKTLLWTSGKGEADVVLRTKSPSLRVLIESGALPSDVSLARKWSVRCVPSRVRIKSRTEIEIEESP